MPRLVHQAGVPGRVGGALPRTRGRVDAHAAARPRPCPPAATTTLLAGAQPHPPRPALPASRAPSSFRSTAIAAAAAADTATQQPLAPAITVTPAARDRLVAMLAEKKEAGEPPLVLRVGVKSGGCNGMSYTMDFVEAGTVTAEDARVDLGDGVAVVCDSKSLLFLFGLELTFSGALIGGGFGFKNPNAEGECGCGKSFNV